MCRKIKNLKKKSNPRRYLICTDDIPLWRETVVKIKKILKSSTNKISTQTGSCLQKILELRQKRNQKKLKRTIRKSISKSINYFKLAQLSIGAIAIILSVFSYQIGPASAYENSILIQLTPQQTKTAVEAISRMTLIDENPDLAAISATEDGFIEKPTIVSTNITPPDPPPPPSQSQSPSRAPKPPSKTSQVVRSVVQNFVGNLFPGGYCTSYVASRRSIPWHGNAGTWYRQAQNYGFATGQEPRAGVIIVTSESWAGHVGIVEAVNGDSVTISEMNFLGYGRISTRTISKNYSLIIGYIY